MLQSRNPLGILYQHSHRHLWWKSERKYTPTEGLQILVAEYRVGWYICRFHFWSQGGVEGIEILDCLPHKKTCQNPHEQENTFFPRASKEELALDNTSSPHFFCCLVFTGLLIYGDVRTNVKMFCHKKLWIFVTEGIQKVNAYMFFCCC